MTAQIPETLHWEGRQVPMCTEPLDDYFTLVGTKPRFAVTCTALWRGYVGEWEIRDGRLYLVGISATLAEGQEATLESIFPGFPDRVFAHWYSGILRIPQGKLLEYFHGGFGSVYETDLLVDVEDGVLKGTRERRNGVSEDPEAAEGYEVAAMTTLPRRPNEEGTE